MRLELGRDPGDYIAHVCECECSLADITIREKDNARREHCWEKNAWVSGWLMDHL